MFEGSNNDILFKKSLRSGSLLQKKSQNQKQSQCLDFHQFNNLLCEIVFDLENKQGSIETAIHLLTRENKDLQFKFFIPSAKTAEGERILKEQNIWVVILVVFYSICKINQQYSLYLLQQIEQRMELYVLDKFTIRSIKESVFLFLNQQNQIIEEEGLIQKQQNPILVEQKQRSNLAQPLSLLEISKENEKLHFLSELRIISEEMKINYQQEIKFMKEMGKDKHSVQLLEIFTQDLCFSYLDELGAWINDTISALQCKFKFNRLKSTIMQRKCKFLQLKKWIHDQSRQNIRKLIRN